MKGMVADPEECEMVSCCCSQGQGNLTGEPGAKVYTLVIHDVKHFQNLANYFVMLFQEELRKLGDINNSLAIFCMATYGEGDPTDNAQEFFDWLQEGSCELNGLNYAVSLLSYFV